MPGQAMLIAGARRLPRSSGCLPLAFPRFLSLVQRRSPWRGGLWLDGASSLDSLHRCALMQWPAAGLQFKLRYDHCSGLPRAGYRREMMQ